jgi:RES domain-containing protein
MDAIEMTTLPSEWETEDPPLTTRQPGMDWFNRRTSLLLKVPSAIIPTEFNYVINPRHPDFNRLLIGQPIPFRFDPRLQQ